MENKMDNNIKINNLMLTKKNKIKINKNINNNKKQSNKM
jgi:hypothetical protein